MQNNREEAISICLKWEGGYGNDPSDAGGPTNYGITIADVRKYLNPSATAQDVRALTKSQAINIYRSKYWKTPYYDCDKLPSGVDLAVFDFGVNSGVSRSARYFAACKGSPVEVVKQLCDKRADFIRSAGGIAPKFKQGLLNRVADIRSHGVNMAQRKPVAHTNPIAVAITAVVAAFAGMQHWFNLHWRQVAVGVVIAAMVGGSFWLHRKVTK